MITRYSPICLPWLLMVSLSNVWPWTVCDLEHTCLLHREGNDSLQCHLSQNSIPVFLNCCRCSANNLRMLCSSPKTSIHYWVSTAIVKSTVTCSLVKPIHSFFCRWFLILIFDLIVFFLVFLNLGVFGKLHPIYISVSLYLLVSAGNDASRFYSPRKNSSSPLNNQLK